LSARTDLQRRQDKRLRELGLADAFALTDATHKKAVALLEGYGNILSKPHSDALFLLASCFSMLALGKESGRFAFDLGTGCGKTTAIVAFIAALCDTNRHESVAVCSEKVEQLCQLYRDLIAAGVPAESIGLKHNYAHDPEQRTRFLAGKPLRDGYASEAAIPATGDLRAYPVVLYTHNRAYLSNSNASVLDQVSTYLGPFGLRQRNLILWDEALMSSTHVSVHWPTFERQLGGLLRLSTFPDGRYDELRPILAYFEQCSHIIKAQWLYQNGNGSEPPAVFKLPILPATLSQPEEDGSPHRAWKKLLSLGDESMGQLISVLEQANRPARLVSVAAGVISFDVAVPDALRNIAILDASAPVRKLMDADSTIKRYVFPGDRQPFNGRVVSYENVTIRWAKAGAGRSTVEGDKRHSLIRDVVRLVQDIPKDQGVIIFTFKPRTFGRDTLSRLRSRLEEVGVDLDAKVEFRGQQRPRIVFLTWGQETSLSHFQYAQNVVTCGVLERSDWDLAGALAGQRRDLQTDITADTLRDIKLSEATHILYQAFSRGSARVIVNGKASPMRVWLCHREADQLQETLSEVMPGAVWLPWETEFLPQWSKISSAVSSLRAVLAATPVEKTRLLIREWKQQSAPDVDAKLFQREVRDFALEGTGWRIAADSNQHLERQVNQECAPVSVNG
jgi:hypothetical protein